MKYVHVYLMKCINFQVGANILADRYPLTRYDINMIYHNDRTKAQVEALKAFLLERGAKDSQINFRTSREARKEGANNDLIYVKMTLRAL